MKALLIGCGNIGALYDLNTNEIKTHAKALSFIPSIVVSLFDENVSQAKKIASLYHYKLVEDKATIKLADFELVIIASPTKTHFEWLCKCFESNVKLVICEKPLSTNKKELEELEIKYKNSNTKVVVNYIRRFQEAYIELKQIIEKESKAPLQILVKYQRGITNNFSHAADLIQFFYGQCEFSNLNITDKIFDEFENDPTCSFTGKYGKIPISVIGLANVKYSYFEIEIFYKNKKIAITNSGDNIRVISAKEAQNFYLQLTETEFEKTDILRNYMKNVYEIVEDVFSGKLEDNFIESIMMGNEISKIIN